MDFNSYISKKSLTHYANIGGHQLDKVIEEHESFVESYTEELYKKIEELIYDEADNSHSEKYMYSLEDFEIYLDILEFDSIYSIQYKEIETQHKKLSKKYTKDSKRLQLVNSAYIFLKTNYPR